MARGPKRNFQILDLLEFLAEFTQHIPPKGAHLIRYYGWYSAWNRRLERAKKACQRAFQADGAFGVENWQLPEISPGFTG